MLWVPILLVVSLLALACSGGDDEGPAITTTPAAATSTPSPEVSPSATSTPSPEPTPTAEVQEITSTTWLVDIDAGVVSEVTPKGSDCIATGSGADVGGRFYASVECGPISPDARWMTYQVTVGTTGANNAPIWDQWVVNLETDERRLLQEGLVHCGGCDGRFGESWSPSGRYLYFSEWIQDGRIFLSNVETGQTRVISEGSTEITAMPRWALGEDALLYRTAEGAVVYENLTSSSRMTLTGAPWPVRLDATGSLALSTVFAPRGGEPGHATTFIDSSSGATIATLSGQAAYPVFGAGNVYKAAATDVSFVAALDAPEGCDGVGIYNGPDSMTCLPRAKGAVVSPDATKIGFARETGTTQASLSGLVQTLVVYEIAVYDVSSGAETVVARNAISTDVPPALEWTEGSTELLVRWPVFAGP